VLCDGGEEGLAERAAARLEALGWSEVAVLAGGTAAWREAGLPLYSGVNVPSKAFGEHVEAAWGTPSIAPEALARMLARGADVVVLDSRPFPEYHARCIPGGLCCPGGELVYRVAEQIASSATMVVVNCAGRTRSIIGAQSLRNAGLPNPVRALANGTMGWHLAGQRLERGAGRRAPPPGAGALAWAREAAAAVARRFAVRLIDRETLARWQAEAGRRTLYLIDVRSPEEHVEGHPRGAISAPGGQLIQETESYLGTRGARVVLLDSDGVRAIMAASWLEQLGGYEVAVLAGGLEGLEQVRGEEPAEVPGLAACRAPEIEAPALAAALARGAVAVIDLSSSRSYRDGHIPGAAFAIRARLAAALRREPPGAALVLTSEDGVLARLAAAEIEPPEGKPVRVLAGGNRAWREAGLALEGGEGRMLDPPEDRWQRPYERDWGDPEPMREYLRWETALPARVAADPTVAFRGPDDFPDGASNRRS